jgi:hypothetical protein
VKRAAKTAAKPIRAVKAAKPTTAKTATAKRGGRSR